MDSNKNFLTMATAPDGALIVAGDIDMAGGPILEQALLERESELLAQGGGDIVVDLTGPSPRLRRRPRRPPSDRCVSSCPRCR